MGVRVIRAKTDAGRTEIQTRALLKPRAPHRLRRRIGVAAVAPGLPHGG
jgi:hypothetical protein